MDEEITIIDSNTRNERIRNFFINNKKKLIITVSIILVIIIGYLSFEKSKERAKIKLANQYNLALIDLNPKPQNPAHLNLIINHLKNRYL